MSNAKRNVDKIKPPKTNLDEITNILKCTNEKFTHSCAKLQMKMNWSLRTLTKSGEIRWNFNHFSAFLPWTRGFNYVCKKHKRIKNNNKRGKCDCTLIRFVFNMKFVPIHCKITNYSIWFWDFETVYLQQSLVLGLVSSQTLCVKKSRILIFTCYPVKVYTWWFSFFSPINIFYQKEVQFKYFIFFNNICFYYNNKRG